MAGDPKITIIYNVERLRDGRSFVTRRITAIRHGQAIFAMSTSFHLEEQGFEHQLPMPQVPAPETLPSEEEFRARMAPLMPPAVKAYFERKWPIEMRPVDMARYTGQETKKPIFNCWIRATGKLPDDPGGEP